MLSKRNIFFIVTVGVFLITAPLVTLYTAGFRYHWKKQRVERVGFFETSSVPSAADVLIDGTHVGKTPYVNTSMFPGDYTLTLSKTGYRSMMTPFGVRSGLSTLLLNELLWKDSQPELIATAESTASLSPTAANIAWTETIPSANAAMISLTNGDKRKLACVLKSGKQPRVSWNSGGSAVMYLINAQNGLDGCIATTAGNSYALSDVLKAPAISVEWSPFDDSHLLVHTATSGYVLSYEGTEPKAVTTKNIPFTIRGSKLYGVRPTASGAELFSQALGTLSLPFGPDNAELPAGEYSFLPSPEKYLVLREAKHGRIDVYETKTLKRLTAVVADRLVFESNGKQNRFFAVSGFELTLHDLDAETSQLIIRNSDPITDVIWHPLGSFALVQSGGKLTAVPFERSSEESVELADFVDVQSLWIDSKADTLIVVGTQNATTGVWKLVLKE